MQCPKCHKNGLAQLFLRRDSTARYARVRHYSHKDKESKKPQFTYCKIENTQSLKTLICQQRISLSVDKAESGHIGQKSNTKIHDQELNNSSSNQQIVCLRSLARWGVTLVR